MGVPKDWKSLQGPESVPKFPAWSQIKISHVAYPKGSKELVELCQALIPSREDVFQKLLKLNSVLGMEGMKLLEMLLQLDPQKRPTAEAILSHPFFTRTTPDSIPTYELSSFSPSILENVWSVYIKNEKEFSPKADYMSKQTTINEVMRSILIDWLIDVSVHFDLSQETLQLSVMYLDRSLSEITIDKSRLQLLGILVYEVI